MEATRVQPSFLEKVMLNMRARPAAWIVIAMTVGFLVIIGIFAGPSQLVNTIVTGGMWALMAVGLALVFGVMNIPHFAHGESFMIGAYVAYFVFTPIQAYLRENPNPLLSAVGPLIGWIAAALVGFVAGAVIEKLVFYPLRTRTRRGWVMNTFLLTVGISFILVYGANLILGPNFRGVSNYWDVPPIVIGSVRLTMERIAAFVVAIVAIVAFWIFLANTRTGRAIRAVAQDEMGAEMVGINLNFIYTLTFALATAMAALAGASLLFMFPAYPTVGLKPLYFAWYVVMLVGLGNVQGAIVGGFIVAVLQTLTQQFFGVSYEDVVPVVVMILVLLLVPNGIFG
ncbi:MAG: branched-chain amino acid ABC transporter permease, partial [Anaerolineae bacterium]|nr:branched-chain amino acid ABC transporter permease [Anaerolineae bacterium]